MSRYQKGQLVDIFGKHRLVSAPIEAFLTGQGLLHRPKISLSAEDNEMSLPSQKCPVAAHQNISLSISLGEKMKQISIGSIYQFSLSVHR